MGLFDRLFGNQKQMQSLVDSVSAEVTSRVALGLQKEFNALNEVENATGIVTALQKQIASLNAEKSNIEEGFARKEREIEHKTGLLRLEIEADQKNAVKEFDLRVKEVQLAAQTVGLQEREKAFTEKMTFIEKRFTEEVGYLKSMVKDMSDRLPTAEILAVKEL